MVDRELIKGALSHLDGVIDALLKDMSIGPLYVRQNSEFLNSLLNNKDRLEGMLSTTAKQSKKSKKSKKPDK